MSATSAGTGPPAALSIFDVLPQDIVFKICDELRPKSRAGKRALIALSCTSSCGRLVAERALYAQLRLNLNNGRQKLVNLLDALLKRPDRAPLIKEIAFDSSSRDDRPWPSRSSTPAPIATLHTTPVRILLNNLAMLDLGYMRRLVQAYDIHGLFPLLIAQATQLRSLSLVGPCIHRPNPLATVLKAPYDIRLQLPTFDRLKKISHWDFEPNLPSGPAELIYAYLRQPHLEELHLRLSSPPHFIWSGPSPSCPTLTTLVLEEVGEANLVKLLSATPKLRTLAWHCEISSRRTPSFRLDILMEALINVAATLQALTLRYGVFDDDDYETDPRVVGSLDLSSFQDLIRLEVPWLILNDFNRSLVLSFVRVPRGVKTLFLDVMRYNGTWGIDSGDLEFSLSMISHERELLLPRLEEVKCGFIEELECP